MSDLDIKIEEIDAIKGIEPLKIDKDQNVLRIQDVSPVAVHLKEVNLIDPIAIESLSVSEVKNLDPIRVEQFNVTNLPTVNVSLRQLPAVDLNIRRVPPLSVGFHQDFHIPSNYSVKARLLGFEFLRLQFSGSTCVQPRERSRQEQKRVHNQSAPVAAVAGNPNIPSRRYLTSAVVYGQKCHGMSWSQRPGCGSAAGKGGC